MTRFAAIHIEEDGSYIHNAPQCRLGWRVRRRALTGSSSLLGVLIPQRGRELPGGTRCAVCGEIIREAVAV